MDETPEQKYDRLQRDIQNAILKEYPNPERTGCPGRSAVEDFAKNPDQITVADNSNPDSKWFHITHCSPCYAEFLQLRTEYRVKRARARVTRRAVILSSLAGLAGASWLISRERTRTVDIDFEKYLSTRGSEESATIRQLRIPTGKLHVQLILPQGSGEGPYTVQIVKEPDSKPVLEAMATAVPEGDRRKLLFDAEVDAAPGAYTLGIRSDHRGVWRYCPVQVERR